MKIALLDETSYKYNLLFKLAQKWGFEPDVQSKMMLVMTLEHLELRKTDEPKLSGIFVDFTSNLMNYRRFFGGGRNEAIAKAVGIKKRYSPKIIDTTAGLGRDAFILASLGCHVQMMERHPVVAALLEDGLQRGYSDNKIGSWLHERLTLSYTDSQHALSKLLSPLNVVDVIYIDPMYPPRPYKRGGMIKKEMRILQSLVGTDDDAYMLLQIARKVAKKRIVVKRPNYAKPLGDIIAQSSILTKKHRFDIYSPLE